ncbi:MAG: hypothetical protein HYZ28_07145 [Myxococcales bacterium]|nr:hypothetical protein [Myxococcales bacterium]
MARRRPNFNQAVKALVKHVAATMAEFSHIRPGRILVVAGEARRSSRGTVKPLTFEGARSRDKAGRVKPTIRLRGRRMLYCVTLRPLFFRASTPQARIATLLHELFHISPRFDGTLSGARRHARLGGGFAHRLRPLVRRYLKRCPPELWAPFAHDGEVSILQWLERPGANYASESNSRKVYTEEQLFWGRVRMITRRARPARGPKGKIRLH